jgi:hypothetical protein
MDGRHTMAPPVHPIVVPCVDECMRSDSKHTVAQIHCLNCLGLRCLSSAGGSDIVMVRTGASEHAPSTSRSVSSTGQLPTANRARAMHRWCWNCTSNTASCMPHSDVCHHFAKVSQDFHSARGSPHSHHLHSIGRSCCCVAMAWLRRYREADDPQLRLFCFPHAGGGPHSFRSW